MHEGKGQNITMVYIHTKYWVLRNRSLLVYNKAQALC